MNNEVTTAMSANKPGDPAGHEIIPKPPEEAPGPSGNAIAPDDVRVDTPATDIQSTPTSVGDRPQGPSASEYQSFEKLYARRSAEYYAFALRFIKDPHKAREAADDTLYQTWQILQAEPGKILDPRAWMYSILRNIITSMARHESRQPLEVLFSELEEKGVPVDAVLATEEPDGAATTVLLREKIVWIFHHLRPNYAYYLFLNVVEGLSYIEIAKVLGISPDRAAVQLTRARKAARKAMELYNAEDA